ncbi:MAG: hypothetical protein ACP5HD_04085 [Thermoproteus sp.]
MGQRTNLFKSFGFKTSVGLDTAIVASIYAIVIAVTVLRFRKRAC